MNKSRRTSGETIAETLVAILIVTFTMLFLATAVVSSARVNASVENADNAFERETDPTKGTRKSATSSMEGVTGLSNVNVNVYKTEGEDGTGGEYYYYERVE